MATLDSLRREIRQRGERAARAAAIQMEQELRRDSPKVTRELERSISVRVRSVGDVITVEALAAADHAGPVIDGSRPHPITPKKGSFLAFYWPNDPRGGNVRKLSDGRVLLRSVNHPGNEANPFWQKSIGRWRVLLQGAIDRLR